jgi:hypothetical protein
MEELIEALQIFAKYSCTNYPTHCEHDIFMIAGVGENDMSAADVAAVQKIGFSWNDEYSSWISYKYGSA